MIRRFLLLLSLFGICLLANPVSAHAFDPFGGVTCSGANSKSAVCTDKSTSGTDPVSGRNGLLPRAITIISIVAGVAAVIVLLIGSISYITSGGDSGKIASAKNMIINALIGIAVIVVVRTIVVYIIDQVG